MNPFSNMILLGKLDLLDFYISTMIRFHISLLLNPNDTLSELILSSNLADYFKMKSHNSNKISDKRSFLMNFSNKSF